jgi:ribose transport system permease protein
MWALNTNLNSGRMDFSLGATGILAALIASKVLGGVSYNTLSGIIGFLSLTVLFGMIIGLVGGLVYILTRLPAIVTSLGMCLVFEGIAAIIEGKSGQVQYRTTGTLAARFTSQPVNIILILVIVIFIMSLIICYSRFGYNKNALVYNQKIACDTGINEIVSCIVCYILAGALIGLYEVLQDLSSTYMTLSVDLGSASTVFRNFLPIFVGSMMTRYSNQLISSFCACFATTLLSRGLDNAAAIGITSPISSLITSVMILCVLTYMVDKQAFINWLKMRRYLYKQKRLGLKKN